MRSRTSSWTCGACEPVPYSVASAIYASYVSQVQKRRWKHEVQCYLLGDVPILIVVEVMEGCVVIGVSTELLRLDSIVVRDNSPLALRVARKSFYSLR